jgi:cyclic pyranopterin phosphate synthase
MTSKLTHIDASGAARMVDVSDKETSLRIAVASSRIALSEATLHAIKTADLKKGDVIGTARIAGIMAAKETSRLIPLCHGLNLDDIDVDFTLESDGIAITTTARCEGRTGVEMEALTAASIAALTIYDMVKAMDREAVIGPTMLLEKRGGKSGDWQRDDP